MSIRAYKWLVGILVCVVLLLAWRWFSLSQERVDAAFISFECETTDQISDGATDPKDVADRVRFLENYYQDHSRALDGSPLQHIVEREYQQSLTNAVNAFHRMTTNDLGSDIDVWLKKYGD